MLNVSSWFSCEESTTEAKDEIEVLYGVKGEI
jgi:hypothetical protein